VNVAGFRADADLVGGRIRVSWEFVAEGGESQSDIPRVVVRRKQRDFEFPPHVDGTPDPFLVYDSAAFPPLPDAQTSVSDLPGWQARDAGTRTSVAVISVAVPVGSRRVEIRRRTTSTTTAIEDGRFLRQRVEILDVGNPAEGLLAGTTYYYQVFSAALSGPDPRPYRATATATRAYRLAENLYQSLPSIYRRHDVVTRPPTPGAEFVPEAAPGAGQMRRFLDPFGASLDLLRSSAEGLWGLHDIDHVDYRFLAPLAGWIGWDLSFGASIPIQRHEVKYAARLYQVTGTIPGCLIWVMRLSGWRCRVKEFYPNVFFSNDMGLLDRPDDVGSRTVDTSNAEMLANIGTPDDRLDYTYDTGTTDLDWYAYNVVGLFVYPEDGESAADIARKRDRLKRNLSIFLPVNIRGVVIVQAPRIVEPPTGDQFDFREAVTERNGV
jgi:phage tail-like protein